MGSIDVHICNDWFAKWAITYFLKFYILFNSKVLLQLDLLSYRCQELTEKWIMRLLGPQGAADLQIGKKRTTSRERIPFHEKIRPSLLQVKLPLPRTQITRQPKKGPGWSLRRYRWMTVSKLSLRPRGQFVRGKRIQISSEFESS